MMGFIDAALSRSRTVILTLILLLLAGTVAYVTIAKESDPDINIPIIYVSLHLEGISPEDAERLLIRPMEQELRSVEGVKEMTATAYQGGGNVTMEFEAGFDVDKALEDVREKVDVAKVDLPDEADEPTVNEVNLSLFPVLVVTLSGDVPERTLLRLARNLRDEVESIPTVLEADIAGDREELVEVVIDPLRIESYGLRADEVLSLFNRSNLLVAAGNVDTGQGRFAIKVPGLFENIADISNMPIKTNGDAVVRLVDVAEIRRTFKDPESFARVNGNRAVALEVVKRSGENIIETIEAVRAIVESERQYWPKEVKVGYTQDRSSDIRNMLGDLQNNMISAVLLVMIICIGALGLRSAGLVGVAIPGSFLTGILVIYTMGLTINIVVLFSLILAVGMLVDGAIVVTEYADRKMSEGLPRKEAYGLASKRMAWPIIASTATTLAAFMPLLFWPGTVGEFMKFLPITLLATLTASLAMALVFVPTLGAHLGKAGGADPSTMKALAAGEAGDIRSLPGFTGRYVRLLNGALRRPGLIVAGAALMLMGVQMSYGVFGKGVEFFPEVEPENAQIFVHARGNLSIWEQDALIREVEQRILPMEGIETIYTRTSLNSQGGQDVAEDVIGSVSLEFADWDTRVPASVILDDIRAATDDLAGIHVEPRKEEAGPPVGKPIALQLSSYFPELLPPAIDQIRRFMESDPDFVDIEDSRTLPGIEWELSVDRAQASKYGLDLQAVGSIVQLVTKGLQIGTYRPNDSDDEIDIVVRYPEPYRHLGQLDELRLETPNGSIPLANFVELSPQPKVGNINRADAQRILEVKSELVEGVLPADKVGVVRAFLESANIDPRIQIEFKGEDEEQQESQQFLMQAFGIALFVMAIILVTQFNSFYNALLILTAVIMSTIGVMIGLMITGQPFGVVMTGVGVIALAGIVVNNNIVLIDTYDRLRKDGIPAREAVLRTGAQRLRPVLLTTTTTILGLIPMVLRVNIDFVTRAVQVGAPSTQWWASLATAIVFGLAFATILTLIVTPSALLLHANIKAWRNRTPKKTSSQTGPDSVTAPGLARAAE